MQVEGLLCCNTFYLFCGMILSVAYTCILHRQRFVKRWRLGLLCHAMASQSISFIFQKASLISRSRSLSHTHARARVHTHTHTHTHIHTSAYAQTQTIYNRPHHLTKTDKWRSTKRYSRGTNVLLLLANDMRSLLKRFKENTHYSHIPTLTQNHQALAPLNCQKNAFFGVVQPFVSWSQPFCTILSVSSTFGLEECFRGSYSTSKTLSDWSRHLGKETENTSNKFIWQQHVCVCVHVCIYIVRLVSVYFNKICLFIRARACVWVCKITLVLL